MSIEARDVTFRYPGDAMPAVAGISLTVEPGEVVGIVGPNGSGKSTMGRLLKGLLLPEEGSVTVDGIDARADSIAVRRLVGLLFQNPNSQIVNSVVEQEVAFGPENLGLPSSEIRRRVDSALAAVGLTGRETAECHSLSMADKQRVALAAIIAMAPRYLILDEPTAWIEPSARWRVLGEIFAWARQEGAGLVLITHRMDEALLCRRLYGILHARLIASGAPDELLGDAAIRERLALSVPDAYALTAALHDEGLPVKPGESLEQVAELLCRP